MILTCPECATSYFVDEARIPAEGRRVRCSSCGHRWTAGRDGEVIDPAVFEAAPEPEPDEGLAPEAAFDDLEVAPVEEEPVPIPAPVRRAQAGRRGRGGEGRSRVLVWAGAAGLVAALIAGAVVFREQVVRLLPASSAAYAGLGLEVGGHGLQLEHVRAQAAFLAGRPVLSVTGAIRNPRQVAIDAPPVRVTLFNGAGKPVAAKIARPADASIPPGAQRHFAITLIDPPASARDLEVRFEPENGAKPAARAAEAALSPTPAAPHPVTPAPMQAAPAPAQLSPAVATEHG